MARGTLQAMQKMTCKPLILKENKTCHVSLCFAFPLLVFGLHRSLTRGR